MTTQVTFMLPDEAATIAFGKALAKAVKSQTVIYLEGQLGAGKTTLTRGFLRGFGYTERVKSPTYTLVEPYILDNGPIYHFDLYRLNDPLELELMGLQDYFGSDSICLIEWPDKGGRILPAADLICRLTLHQAGRELVLTGLSDHGNTILQRLQA